MSNPLISHIGIAVSDLNKALETYKLLTGDSSPHITEVAEQQVEVAIFADASKEGGRIELVAPTSDSSPVAKYISKNGEGLHHICIYVSDIEMKLAELKKAGVRLIDETPKIGAEGNKIAFIHPKSMNGVLIELEELR